MIVSRTPLRVSFFGGGTDFHDYFTNSKYGYGTVLSTTIKMYTYIIINKRFDDKIRLVYYGNELVDKVDDIKHNIIREALKITGIDKGIEIIYLSDLPMTSLGVGLASSSSLSVGVLNALHTFKGEKVSKEQLAKEAIDIEINRLKQEIGIQDQYEVAFGGLKKYTFNKDLTVSIDELNIGKRNIKKLTDNLMMFYTGIARDSRSILKEQKKTTKNHSEILDSLVELTNKAYDYLVTGKIDDLGKLFLENWNLKKKFATDITNETIDDMLNLAIQNGAYGGKILGAGGGGFLLLYVPKNKQNKVRKALEMYKEIEFNISDDGSTIVYQD